MALLNKKGREVIKWQSPQLLGQCFTSSGVLSATKAFLSPMDLSSPTVLSAVVCSSMAELTSAPIRMM